MKLNKSRTLMLISVILLALTFFFPIWKIDLDAPQYPEGIGLRIWINKITGVNEFDLNNINKLNHYIGMKAIEPDSIPELKLMPLIVVFFIILGILSIIMNKKILTAAWTLLLFITLLIGLYDYYIWEYDYGHNLNPNAPIKVPGMSYQPPLVGTKQLLNMRTTSMPDTGSFLIAAALVLNLITIFNINSLSSKKKIIGLIVFILIGCKEKLEEIKYLQEECSNCQMTISDNHFGAELITKKRKIYKFDSIECLASYSQSINSEEILSMWVTDFANPPNMIDTKNAYYLRSDKIMSPMGLNVCAFSDSLQLKEIKRKYGGVKISWNEIIELTKNEQK